MVGTEPGGLAQSTCAAAPRVELGTPPALVVEGAVVAAEEVAEAGCPNELNVLTMLAMDDGVPATLAA